MTTSPEPKYEACDDLVMYRDRRVRILGRWYSPDNGSWLYEVKIIESGRIFCNVPESALEDMPEPRTPRGRWAAGLAPQVPPAVAQSLEEATEDFRRERDERVRYATAGAMHPGLAERMVELEMERERAAQSYAELLEMGATSKRAAIARRFEGLA